MLQREVIDYLLINACNAAIVGARAILKLYDNKDVSVSYKPDSTIITEADRVSHESIKQYLSKTRVPLLSEEGRNMLYEERYSWDLYWLVDPIDGTREFVQHNDEFVVSIALMSDALPLFGVILQPATGKLYFSDPDRGAFLIENALQQEQEYELKDIFEMSRKLKRRVVEPNAKIRVAITRSHLNVETESFIALLKERYGDIEVVNCGSSIKFCYIAEDIADMYIRFTNLFDWDLAAGVAIAKAVGAKIWHIEDGSEVVFNKEQLEIEPFIVSLVDIEV